MTGGRRVADEQEAIEYVKMFKMDVSPGDRLVMEPCVPEWWRQNMEAASGGEQLCPRVELDPENFVAGSLAATYVQSPQNVLFTVLWDLETQGESPSYKHTLAMRVSNAVNDPEVVSALNLRREASQPKRR